MRKYKKPTKLQALNWTADSLAKFGNDLLARSSNLHDSNAGLRLLNEKLIEMSSECDQLIAYLEYQIEREQGYINAALRKAA